jgi:hypothetical protein
MSVNQTIPLGIEYWFREANPDISAWAGAVRPEQPGWYFIEQNKGAWLDSFAFAYFTGTKFMRPYGWPSATVHNDIPAFTLSGDGELNLPDMPLVYLTEQCAQNVTAEVIRSCGVKAS